MATNFKVGDVVICVRSSRDVYIQEGSIYTIRRIRLKGSDDRYHLLYFNGIVQGYFAIKFRYNTIGNRILYNIR